MSGTESWSIIAKHDIYTVDDTNYSKVVQVRQIGYVTIPNTQEITSVEVDLWLAESIGIIEISYTSGMITSSSLKLKRSSEL